MRDFMIFLENYSVKMTAEKAYEYEYDNSLVFEKDGKRVAEFNIDKICGYAQVEIKESEKN